MVAIGVHFNWQMAYWTHACTGVDKLDGFRIDVKWLSQAAIQSTCIHIALVVLYSQVEAT